MENKKHKLRIFFNSNAVWSTSGYGTQMFDLLPLIRDEGYEVAMCAFYGLEGGSVHLDGIKFYPKMGDVWGSDAMIAHAQEWKADVVITLQDIWVLNPDHLRHVKNWVPVLPIDHEPPPPSVIDRAKMAYRIITYSKFGYNQLKKLGIHSTYIPHTVNTEVLRPFPKKESRELFKVPTDLFLFGMVSANKDNPPRKSFQEAMDAFALFHQKHPKSAMYFHTLVNQQGGFPINEYAKFLGLEGFIYHLQPYDQMFKVGRSEMARIYSMFDILLCPSTNEGFGVPVIEAQSCGVPVIVNNFTAMPELIVPGITGDVCDILHKRFTPLLSYVAVPSPRSIHEKMEILYRMDRKKMGEAARAHILENYELKKIFREKWVPFLSTLEKELYPMA